MLQIICSRGSIVGFLYYIVRAGYNWHKCWHCSQSDLKGVLNGHKSVTSVLFKYPTMLTAFSLFTNIPPNLSGSRSCFISGFDLLLHWHTAVIRHFTTLPSQLVTVLGYNHTHQEQGTLLLKQGNWVQFFSDVVFQTKILTTRHYFHKLLKLGISDIFFDNQTLFNFISIFIISLNSVKKVVMIQVSWFSI